MAALVQRRPHRAPGHLASGALKKTYHYPRFRVNVHEFIILIRLDGSAAAAARAEVAHIHVCPRVVAAASAHRAEAIPRGGRRPEAIRRPKTVRLLRRVVGASDAAVPRHTHARVCVARVALA